MTTGAQGPQSRFEPFAASGVLNEWLTPQQVGGTGLTRCENLVYRRQGGWGKRSGATRTALPHYASHKYTSGIRWYRVFPTIVTKLVVWAQGQMLIGNDQSSLSPVQKGDLTNNAGIAPDFCSMRDPQAAEGNGADILVVAGLTLANGSFGKGSITIQGLPYSNTSLTLTLTVAQGAQTVTTSTYYILPTDNPSSIASQIANMLNQSAAYLNQGAAPFLGVTYYTVPNPEQIAGQPVTQQAIVHLGARNGGADGNNITYTLTIAGTPGTAPVTGPNTPLTFHLGSPPNEISVPTVPTPGAGTNNFFDGGNDWSGPLRYDHGKGVFEGLSYMAPNPFAGCATWHDHLWLWMDPGNPDTVFASDLLQPEAFTFMAENGGMDGPDNGGYNIGPGDGDPAVQTCVPNGNSFCIWKTENIYQVQGYDFQEGEYQFSVSPMIVGYGCPSRDCVDVLEGQYVFWSGKKLLRVAVGAYEPEHIGLTVPLQEGIASSGDQSIVQVAAGDFQVQSLLGENFIPPATAGPQTVLLRSRAFFSFDSDGDGVADLVLCYDDERTALGGGVYAWSTFTGWSPAAWIKYGLGVAPNGGQDKPTLHFLDDGGEHIYFVGNSPNQDWGNPIPWFTQTGWIDFGTPELLKNVHEFYLRVEATAGAAFAATVAPARIVPATPTASQYVTTPSRFTFSPTQAPPNCEALNSVKQFIQPAVQSHSIVCQFSEDGTSGAAFELLSYGIDVNPQEAYGT